MSIIDFYENNTLKGEIVAMVYAESGEKSCEEDYSVQIKILKKNKIAVWDVIDSCERVGSLDTKIKNEESNDILQLLKKYPNIKTIFCNGGKSYKNLQKIVGKNFEIPIYLLPSTSPLHTISFEKKLESWKIIKTFL